MLYALVALHFYQNEKYCFSSGQICVTLTDSKFSYMPLARTDT